MFSYNLNQIVKDFTRVTPKSQSVLDLIFISVGVANYTVSVDEGLSDHKMVCLNIPMSARVFKKPYDLVHVKDYGRADDTSILDVLENRFDEFQVASHHESVEELWQRLKGIIKHCIDKFVPTRTKKSNQKNPWITRDIIHLKRKLARLRKRKNNPIELSLTKKRLKSALVKSKTTFFNKTLTDFLKCSPQKFWRFFADKKDGIEQIMDGEVLLTEKKRYREPI